MFKRTVSWAALSQPKFSFSDRLGILNLMGEWWLKTDIASLYVDIFKIQFFCLLQPKPDMEGHAAPLSPDLQEEPAPWWGASVEKKRRGSGIQSPLWLRCAGCWRDGENGKGLENSAWAFPLCSRIHSRDPVSHIYSHPFSHKMQHTYYIVCSKTRNECCYWCTGFIQSLPRCWKENNTEPQRYSYLITE